MDAEKIERVRAQMNQLRLDDIWSEGCGLVSKRIMLDSGLDDDAKLVYAVASSFTGGTASATSEDVMAGLDWPPARFWPAMGRFRDYMESIGHPLRIKAA